MANNAKTDSIATHWDFSVDGLKVKTYNSDSSQVVFTSTAGSKKITSLNTLKQEATNQEFVLTGDDDQAKLAEITDYKKLKSIAAYWDFSVDGLKVKTYNSDSSQVVFTSTAGSKKITSLNTLKQEATNQEFVLTGDDDQAKLAEITDYKKLKSIAAYWDFSVDGLKVKTYNSDSSQVVFTSTAGSKKITSLNTLKQEATNQEFVLTGDDDQAKLAEITDYKKLKSIAAYWDFSVDGLKVKTYNSDSSQVVFTSTAGSKKITSLNTLKQEATNQEFVLTGDDDQAKLAEITDYKKLKSIAAYWDFSVDGLKVKTYNSDSSQVVFTSTAGSKKITSLNTLKQEATNQEFVLTGDDDQAKLAEITDYKKLKSIAAYWDFSVDGLKVKTYNSDSSQVVFTSTAGSKKITSLNTLKQEATNQEFVLTGDDDQAKLAEITDYKKLKSIAAYWDFSVDGLKVKTYNSDSSQVVFTSTAGSKKITSLNTLKQEATNQEFVLTGDDDQAKLAEITDYKKLKSIAAYWDFSVDGLKVKTYNSDSSQVVFTSTAGSKKITSLNTLKQEATNQEFVLTGDDDQAKLAEITDYKKLKSIAAYWDFSVDGLKVKTYNSDSSQVVFTSTAGSKKITSLNTLKQEATNQEFVLTGDDDQAKLAEITDYKKLKSIAAYWDFSVDGLKVKTYNSDSSQVVFTSTAGSKKITSLNTLKQEATNQEFVLTGDDDQAKLAEITDYKKLKSIAAYWDFSVDGLKVKTYNSDSSQVVFTSTAGSKKITSLNTLKQEATNQEFVLTGDDDQAKLAEITDYKKLKSIAAYWDFSVDGLKVKTYNSDSSQVVFTSTAGSKKITSLNTLKQEATNQEFVLTGDDDQAKLAEITDYKKLKSIAAYWDFSVDGLKVKTYNSDSSQVVFTSTAGSKKITSLNTLKQEATNQEFVLTGDDDQAKLAEITDYKKLKSIAAYWDFSVDGLKVKTYNSDSSQVVFTSTAGSKKITSLNTLKQEATNQEFVLTGDDDQAKLAEITDYKKLKSIAAYWDFSVDGLKVKTYNSDSSQVVFTSTAGSKKITSLNTLKQEATNQEFVLTGDDDQAKLAEITDYKKLKSIAAYWDFSVDGLKVKTYNSDSSQVVFTSTAGSKKITSLNTLKQEATNQEFVLTGDDDQAKLAEITDYKKLKSIAAYWDFSVDGLKVKTYNSDSSQVVFTSTAGSKKITSLNTLKQEATNQEFVLTGDDDQAKLAEITDYKKLKSIAAYWDFSVDGLKVKTYNSDSSQVVFTSTAGSKKITSLNTLKQEATNQEFVLTGDDDQAKLAEITDYKKLKSIAAYWDFSVDGLKVKTYNSDSSQVVFTSTAGSKDITNLDTLKTEATNQGFTLTGDDDQAKLAEITDYKKLKSIAAYWDFSVDGLKVKTYNSDSSQVVFTSTAGSKDITNLDTLKTEATNQGFTLTGDDDQAKLAEITDYKKLKSIAAYWDFSVDGLKVKTYNSDSSQVVFTSTAGSKDITNLDTLKTEATNQGFTLTGDDDQAKLALITDYKKLKSIATYWDFSVDGLKVKTYNSDSSQVVFTSTAGSKDITNLDTLKTEATNQGFTLTGDDDQAKLALITDYKKLKSIATYWDFSVDGLKVKTYNSDNSQVVFTSTDKSKEITGFDTLKQEATNQEFALTGDDDQAKLAEITDYKKLKSFATYGDLTDLDEIVVDYVETNYTFKVGEKRLIESFETFKTELGNQGIATTTINDIDGVVETIDGLTGALNTTNADAKKTTTTTGETGKQNSDSNNLSIILPIVSGVILTIIIIGVLLKKYFKNKKSK